jgi:chromosome segregation ATPase
MALMTEVTRIACPGCRTPLQFKPEALDFPASCAACECRFSVGVYVRLACPKCRQGSKIREGYRGRRVRCIRCNHDFVADEGIPDGAGGRMLVARMLDTDSPLPPETVQPFVPPEAIQGPDVGPATVSGSGVWQISRLLEVERLRAEIEELRLRHGRELASARKAAQQADDRWSTAEGKLVEAMLELGEAEQRTARLVSEHDEALRAADLERRALLSRLDRLKAAVSSAAVGQSEAERLSEEALRKFDAATDDLRSERRKRVELGRVVEDLRDEIKTAREAEKAAQDELQWSTQSADEVAASLREENRKLAAEIETLRGEGARLLRENQSISEEAGDLRSENRRMADELGQASRSYQEFERKARATEEADRLREENRRLTAVIEQARSEAEGLQAKLARELERALGAAGQFRDDSGRPVGDLEPSLRENGRHSGEPSHGEEDIGVIASDAR